MLLFGFGYYLIFGFIKLFWGVISLFLDCFVVFGVLVAFMLLYVARCYLGIVGSCLLFCC